MRQAIEAVQRNEMGWQRAAKQFNVPQSTLRRRARNKNKCLNGVEKGLGNFRTGLDDSMETDLVQHALSLESRLFGLTKIELRRLAYEIAEANGRPHMFNRDKEIAGRSWFESFRKRHPEISVRTPEPTSMARAQSFNRPQVSNFFQVLHETMIKENIPATRLYNMDESGLSTVQKCQKIIACRGKKQVGACTSAERGVHCTVVCCMNSVGMFIPPTVVFPRKRWKPELGENRPPGTLNLCQESGWMTGELFRRWLEHFVEYTNATQENKVLLLLDGHASHKSYEALQFAREHGVILLCFPPHCTHRLQPLDVAFFGPLKTYFDQEVTKWMKNHPGRTVTQFQMSSLFGPAYGKAATAANAISGFRATGIVPFNPDIFPDHLYSPAEVSNRENQNQQEDDVPHEIGAIEATDNILQPSLNRVYALGKPLDIS